MESLETRTLLSGTSFTIATFSDTQYTVESFPQTFKTQTAWIAAHKSDPNYNIAFFTHQGDMLRRGYSDFQAQNASDALQNLDNAGVPYAAAIGNHDYDNSFDDLDQHVSSANFTRWFGDARYASQLQAGTISEYGSSPDQRNHYHVFSAAGQTFLVLSLEWQAPDAALSWGQAVINAHRQLPVILSTHEYLSGSAGSRTTSTPVDAALGAHNGQYIYDNFVAPNRQIFMVISGHTGATWSRTVTTPSGNSVYELAADFEGAQPNGGDGYLQTLQFDLGNASTPGSLTITNVRPSDSPTTPDQFGTPVKYANINFAARFAFATGGAPVADDDTLATAPDGTQALTFDVRGNDFDPDGAVDAGYAVTAGSLPVGIAQNADGSFTYDPTVNPGFRGNLSFAYTLADPQGHVSNSATATLRVNAPPVANPDVVSTPESKAVTINVLVNDSDDNVADNAALRPILTSLPAHGAVFVNNDGTFTYTPDPDPTHQFAADSFTYVASDGKATSAPVSVWVNLRPAAPVYTYPTSETTTVGTRTGTFANLGASDGVVETIKEVISTGADVDQRWKFVNVPAGTNATLAINAWRSFSNPGTGDEYHLQYSTDNATWSDLTLLAPRGSKDVTRTRFEANQPYQLWALPASISGTVYVRATDVNPGGTEVADTLTVDEIFIRSGVAFPQIGISATSGAETAANNRPVTFTVSRTGTGASIRSPLTLSYVLGGSATAGDDYAAPAVTTVTIPAGQSSATFSFTPISDGVVEDPETIAATLAADDAYDVGAASAATGTIADFYLDTTPPGQPAITGVSSTSTTVSLSWSASSDDVGVTSYELVRNGVPVAAVGGTVTSFKDTGLPSNTAFSYVVRARDDAGNVSADSAPAAITTRLPAPALSGSKKTTTVKNKRTTTVTLTWNAIAGASGFYVYASLNGGAWTKTFVAGGSARTYTTGALAAGNWSFKVTASNGNGESDFSNAYSVLV